MNLKTRPTLAPAPRLTADELMDDFEFAETMEERYQLIIELGGELPPFPDMLRAEEYKVQGCQSQVWLVPEVVQADPAAPPALFFQGDSDSQIVKGLVAILVMLLSGKPAQEILDFDLAGLFDRLDLKKHLTPSRANGLNSMIRRIKEIAQRCG